MKKILFYLTSLILVVSVLFSVPSCKKKDSGTKINGYTVIYSHNASEEVKIAATGLAEALGGLDISDDLTIADTNNRKEILVGATNRTETAAYSEAIKLHDYVIEENDGRIIICGGSDTATAQAVKYFSSSYYSKESNTVNTSKYAYNYIYKVDTINIDGNDFRCFNVITNITDGSLDTVIADFKAEFAEKTGFSGTSHGHALNIMLKTDPSLRSDSFLIKISQNDITLSGANIYGIEAAISSFLNEICNKKNVVLENGFIYSGKAVQTENEYDKYINERTPLYNTYKRLNEDKSLNVVYFGSSVTAGHGASDISGTWRSKVGSWFTSTFPDAEINSYNASISNSGSMLGAFRCEHDVTSLSPDLVFIDFAANDAYCQTADADIEIYFEHIIRTIKQKNPKCDIVVLYITDQSNARNTSNGLLPQAVVQDKIAKYYGISSVSVGQSLCEKFDYTSDEEWATYFYDIVHPTNIGYNVYFEVIREYLETNLIYGDAYTETIPDYILKEKLSQTEFSPKYILPSKMNIVNNINWEISGDSYWDTSSKYEGYLYPTSNNNELTISFKGNHAALFTQYSIDDRLTYSFDNNHERIQNQKSYHPLLLEASMSEETDEHTLRLKVQLKDETPFIVSALLIW